MHQSRMRRKTVSFSDNDHVFARTDSFEDVTPDTPLLAPTDCHDVSVKLSPEEALVHLIKGLTGTGLLSLPLAFYNAGLWAGLVTLIVVCALSTYCMRMLATCADFFRERYNRPGLDYANLARYSLVDGVPALSKFGYTVKFIVNVQIFIASYGTCCIYFVFLAENSKQVLDVYFQLPKSLWIVVWLLPCLALCMIRQLKSLALAALLADIVYVAACVLTFQHLLYDLPSSARLPPIATDMNKLALAMGSIMFAFEGVCLVLPIANQIGDRPFFIAYNGVLNTGCALVTVIYTCVGFYGYIKFGDDVADTITLNLPHTGIYPFVRVAFCLAIFVTFAIQFYVPTERMEKWISRKFYVGEPRTQRIIMVACRVAMVALTFAIAELVPHLGLIISLIGAYGSSSLALLFPAIIDVLTERAQLGHVTTYTAVKDSVIVLVAILAISTGTYAALASIALSFVE